MSDSFEAFIKLFSDLPREGPGTVNSLLNVLEIADTPPLGRVLDAACGSGADTETILRALPGVEVIGIDQQATFIEAAKKRRGGARFHTGDMLWPEGEFDLIWCAGGVYFVGMEVALQAWRNRLRPGGMIAFSDITWLGTPSTAAKEFWDKAYPQMDSLNGQSARIEACGYKLLSAEPLGRAGWDPYYNALREKIEKLEGQSPEVDEVLAETEAEIAIYDQHFGEYDYVVYLVIPA